MNTNRITPAMVAYQKETGLGIEIIKSIKNPEWFEDGPELSNRTPMVQKADFDSLLEYTQWLETKFEEQLKS